MFFFFIRLDSNVYEIAHYYEVIYASDILLYVVEVIYCLVTAQFLLALFPVFTNTLPVSRIELKITFLTNSRTFALIIWANLP